MPQGTNGHTSLDTHTSITTGEGGRLLWERAGNESEVGQHHVILDRPSLINTQIAIAKSAICLNAGKAGYCFDLLRNESASTVQVQVNTMAPHLVYLSSTFVLEFELALQEHVQDQRLHVQASKKNGSRIPLRQLKLY